MLKELRGGTATHKSRERIRRRSFVFKFILILTLVLLVLLIAAIAYVFFSGKFQAAERTPLPQSPQSQIKKPQEPDENLPVGLSVQTLTTPLSRDNDASIYIKTRPKAACMILVIYDGEVEKNIKELYPKTADEYGLVDWTWFVPTNVPLGVWPVEVTCAYKEKTGTVSGKLEVTR